MLTRLFFPLLLVVAGCASTSEWKPLDSSVLKGQPGRTIGVVPSEPTTFYARTVVKAMTGLIGLAMMASDGKKIITETQIVAPSFWIGSRLSVALSTKHSLVQTQPKLISAAHQVPVRWDTDLVLQ